ncbi:MAG TPA: hypothetical protein VFX60_16385 [Micromonospora sp.]|nr:hypothetical protein [Micromonospora sp.]
MRTRFRLRVAYRGRHHIPVLATFRPTWRQMLLRGLGAGAAGSVVLLVAASSGLLGIIVTAGWPDVGWLAFAPLPVAVLSALVIGRCSRVRLDRSGVHRFPPTRDGFTPWALVTDVRAERWQRRTVIAVYCRDESVHRLPAPYDGEMFGRDPQFERKLFLICHLWSTHRTCRRG